MTRRMLANLEIVIFLVLLKGPGEVFSSNVELEIVPEGREQQQTEYSSDRRSALIV